MNGLTLSALAKVTDGEGFGEDVSINSYCTDSRKIIANSVYFCLRGDRFDGHDFVNDAIAQGVCAIVCEERSDTDLPQLVVSDSRRAFGLYANLWRRQMELSVIGVTGSNGKTTVKQLLAGVFEQAGQVHFTRANDNNEIGVPQTLLGLTEEHDYAVVEMGASARGEIKWLGSLVQPSVAVITNASAAHLEGFGDAQSVAVEKAHIYTSLSDEGVAVINADDQNYDYWLGVCKGKKVITFGRSGDVIAKRSSDGSGITIEYDGQSASCSYALYGEHNVQNAAAAAACAIAAGLPLSVIANGLSTVDPVAGRLNTLSMGSGITVIDDTYNANPASTRAAIDVLAQSSGQRLMVLGDLLELGASEVEHHQSIGEYARTLGVDRLFTFGDLAQHAARTFGDHGDSFHNKAQLIDALNDQISNDEKSDHCTVLVKGSRSMKMEDVVAAVAAVFADTNVPDGVCCQ